MPEVKRVKINGTEVVDRAQFAAMLGVQLHSGFDKRRQREAGRQFPREFVRLHGHPYWRRRDAEAYARDWTDSRLKDAS